MTICSVAPTGPSLESSDCLFLFLREFGYRLHPGSADTSSSQSETMILHYITRMERTQAQDALDSPAGCVLSGRGVPFRVPTF